MRTKLAAIGATLLLGAMVVGTTLTVASAGGNEVELRFRAKTTEQTFLDLGEKGDSLGDQFIFHDVLRQAGERVGHDGGVCTVTSVEGPAGEAQCVVTAYLSEGQITIQGLIVETGETPGGSRSPSRAEPASMRARPERSTSSRSPRRRPGSSFTSLPE